MAPLRLPPILSLTREPGLVQYAPHMPLNPFAYDEMKRKAELQADMAVWADLTSRRMWIARGKKTSPMSPAEMRGVVGDLVAAALGTYAVANQLSSLSGLNAHHYVSRNIAGGLNAATAALLARMETLAMALVKVLQPGVPTAPGMDQYDDCAERQQKLSSAFTEATTNFRAYYHTNYDLLGSDATSRLLGD